PSTHLSSLSLHDALPICLQLFDRVLVTIHDRRGFRQALAFEESQHDHLPLFGRQSSQPMLDLIQRNLLLDSAEDRAGLEQQVALDRKSTRLNSSHLVISY